MPDVAIAHDQFSALGGAERVAVEMARTFNAPIYAMHVDQETAPGDVDVIDMSSKLGTLAMSSHYLAQDLYQMLAWQHVPELYEHDIIIQNKTNPMWFVPRDDQTVVRYLHSPPRGMYDQFHRRGAGLLSRLIKFPQRPLFRPCVTTCDAWVVNSELVQRRAGLYWGVDSTVVYPPVNVHEYSPDDEPTGEYYVAIGRLHGHKRMAQAVAAANRLGAPLKLAGDGPERDRLEHLAGDTVDVLGYVSEDEKRELLSGAKAVLMTAENEDFGIVPVEAFASGTPVIGADEGFTRKQIMDGENGLLYDGTTRGLVTALERFEHRGVEWDADRIEQFSERFSRDRFRDGIQRAVRRAVEDSAVTVPWDGVGQEDEAKEPELVATDGGES